MPADIHTQRDGERLCFTPDGRGLVFMRAAEATPCQDFWLLNLGTKNVRRLIRLTDRAAMRTFDITPDGKTDCVRPLARESVDEISCNPCRSRP